MITHLVVNALVHLLLVVEDDEGLGRRSLAVEDEAEVTTLALHVTEVNQRCVQSDRQRIQIFIWYVFLYIYVCK